MSEQQERWWQERWQRYVLEELLPAPPSAGRLTRARTAKVRITAARGRIAAAVHAGPYGRDYTATLKAKPLTERQWRKVLAAVADRPAAAHGLLSGSPGPELEEAFAAADAALFPAPQGSAVPIHCTCRKGPGCVHAVAMAVHGAELLAANPFLWLEVLGLRRSELLAALRAHLADRGSATPGAEPESAHPLPDADAGADPRLDPDRFWETPENPDAIPTHRPDGTAPDALLRALGDLPLPAPARTVERMVEREASRGAVSLRVADRVGEPVEEVLRDWAVHIGDAAAQLARGERPPRFQSADLPGRALPLRRRLWEEAEAELIREGRPLSVEALLARCPTAAALPEHGAVQAMRDALEAAPPEVAILADRYAGFRPAFIRDARFHHIITFDEWYRQQLLPDADWARALAAAGYVPPYSIHTDPPGPLFASLQPEVGDELILTVIDPAAPELAATLRRRAGRDLTAPIASNEKAANALLRHLKATGATSLEEREAVAVLLGEGLYRTEPGPDPVWLLAASGEEGLFSGGRSRTVITQPQRAWQPFFGRPRHPGIWPENQRLLQQFTALLAHRGESPTRRELAEQVIQSWLRFWRGPHYRPGHPPSIAALLCFLFIQAPLAARHSPAAAEVTPTFLSEWFHLVAETTPDPQADFRPHLAACGLTEAYAHRLRTLPEAREGEEALRLWQLEGLRWLGPWRYFA